MEHFSDILLNEGIVARDSSMVKLYSDALSIAPTDANILIVGASGTGKDCLAKFIHRHSPRAGAPFIHINCSAIPAELFESEFFGYESGAFTGSSASGRQGLIAQAAGGTLFLDEIGELDLDLQTKLLQVVQEHSMRSIGSTAVSYTHLTMLRPIPVAAPVTTAICSSYLLISIFRPPHSFSSGGAQYSMVAMLPTWQT